MSENKLPEFWCNEIPIKDKERLIKELIKIGDLTIKKKTDIYVLCEELQEDYDCEFVLSLDHACDIIQGEVDEPNNHDFRNQYCVHTFEYEPNEYVKINGSRFDWNKAKDILVGLSLITYKPKVDLYGVLYDGEEDMLFIGPDLPLDTLLHQGHYKLFDDYIRELQERGDDQLAKEALTKAKALMKRSQKK